MLKTTKNIKFVQIIVAISIIISMIISIIIHDTIVTRLIEVEIMTAKLSEGQSIKIMQISDLHEYYNKKIFKILEGNNVDLIAVTGDIIEPNSSEKELVDAKKFMSDLTKYCSNIYFVIGNHDYESSEIGNLVEFMKNIGIKTLNEDIEKLEIKGVGNIIISGISWPKKDIYNDTNRISGKIDSNSFNILLSHRPLIPNIYNANTSKIDLILSGHNHGGQIAIPFIGAVVIPTYNQLFPKYDKGLFEIGKNKYQYISAGVGTSNIPIRMFSQSEINIITIKGESDEIR